MFLRYQPSESVICFDTGGLGEANRSRSLVLQCGTFHLFFLIVLFKPSGPFQQPLFFTEITELISCKYVQKETDLIYFVPLIESLWRRP